MSPDISDLNYPVSIRDHFEYAVDSWHFFVFGDRIACQLKLAACGSGHLPPSEKAEFPGTGCIAISGYETDDLGNVTKIDYRRRAIKITSCDLCPVKRLALDRGWPGTRRQS